MGDFEEKDTQKDIVDLILAAAKEYQVLVDAGGNETLREVNNPETIYYMTRIVNSPTFAYFVKQLKLLENLAHQAAYCLPPDMADHVKKYLLDLVDTYKRSIDAKSSETFIDKDRQQANLISILYNRKTEKHITVKDNAKKGITQSFLGGNEEE